MAIKPLATADPSTLKGLSILVTGATSGLGRSAATFLAQHGAFITIAGRRDGSAIVADLSAQDYKAQYVYCDISSWDSQVAAFQAALSFSPTKSLDAVAAFAATDTTGHIVDKVAASSSAISLDGPPPRKPDLETIDVNLKGTFYTAALALHYLRLPAQTSSSVSSVASKSKSLTIVSSMSGYVDETHSTAYMASKFGIRGLFRGIRERTQSDLNVRVNTLAPWAMQTPMFENAIKRVAGDKNPSELGITIVPHVVLSQALCRIVLDEEISGRAIAIMPEGAVDLGDDVEGGYGGPTLVELMALRKEAGDFQHR